MPSEDLRKKRIETGKKCPKKLLSNLMILILLSPLLKC